MIRVLHLLEEEYPSRSGGVERYVHFLFGNSKTNCKIKNIFITAKQFGLNEPYGLRPQTIGYPSTIYRPIRNWIDAIQIDIIHVHHSAPFGLALLENLAESYPLIIHWHDHFILCQRTQLYPFMDKPCSGPAILKCSICLSNKKNRFKLLPLMPIMQIRSWRSKHILNLCSAIVIPQVSILDNIPKKFHNKCIQIPYESEAFWEADRVAFQRKSNSADNLKKFWAVIGGPSEHKGIKDLIRELENIQFQGKLSVFGEGWDHHTTLPDFVNLKGKLITHEQLTDCSHLIIPSKWQETGPLVAIEAHQMGLMIWARRGAISSEVAQKYSISIYDKAIDIKPSSNLKLNVKQLPDWTGLRDKYYALYSKSCKSLEGKF